MVPFGWLVCTDGTRELATCQQQRPAPSCTQQPSACPGRSWRGAAVVRTPERQAGGVAGSQEPLAGVVRQRRPSGAVTATLVEGEGRDVPSQAAGQHLSLSLQCRRQIGERKSGGRHTDIVRQSLGPVKSLRLHLSSTGGASLIALRFPKRPARSAPGRERTRLDGRVLSLFA